jgi:hypothetical protein
MATAACGALPLPCCTPKHSISRAPHRLLPAIPTSDPELQTVSSALTALIAAACRAPNTRSHRIALVLYQTELKMGIETDKADTADREDDIELEDLQTGPSA